MRVQVTAKDRSFAFEAGRGEKVLYAGLRSGAALPYECATGTCGTCKARLLAGEVEELWVEAPGKKSFKPGRNEFLMCQCTAKTDLEIEVARAAPPFAPGECPVGPRTGTIRAVRALTHDVSAIDVALELPCDFEAGQFMAVNAPGLRGARGYSMVNFERGAQVLEFVVKKKPGGGFSEWLFSDKAAGCRIELVGPLGKAIFTPGTDKNLLVIAGGSGIAGMMSILKRATEDGHFARHKGWVFFGVRTMKDLFYARELSKLAAGNLSITVALSEEDAPATTQWPQLRFERGFVHEVAKRAMAGTYDNVRAYIAGPPPAVDATIRFLLVEAKLKPDAIRYDRFS